MREIEFKKFLRENISTESFYILRKFCKGRMSSYFGFYENLEVNFSPAYDHLDNLADLTIEQGNAFIEAFRVLKEKAPVHVLETSRYFCHC
jgi:hypothetical protein